MTPTQEELVGTGANPPVPTRHLTVDQAGAAIAMLVTDGHLIEAEPGRFVLSFAARNAYAAATGIG